MFRSFSKMLVLVAATMCIANTALACMIPIDQFWVINQGSSGGRTDFYIGTQVEILPQFEDTNCDAGLGLDGPSLTSLAVTGVSVTIADPSGLGIGDPFDPLAVLMRDPLLDPIFSGLSPAFDFFGATGVPEVFSPPDELFKLWFDLSVDDAEVPLLLGSSAAFIAGSGLDGDRAYVGGAPFALADAIPISVPEPGTLALMFLGLLGLGFERLRRARQTDS